MLVNELVPLCPKDKTEVVEAHDDALDLLTADERYGHAVPIPPNPVEKLILDIDLILDHHSLTSSPQKRCHLVKGPIAIQRFIPPAHL